MTDGERHKGASSRQQTQLSLGVFSTSPVWSRSHRRFFFINAQEELIASNNKAEITS